LKTPPIHITGTGYPFIWMHGMLNSVAADSIYSLVDFDRLSKKVCIIRYDAGNKSPNHDYSWTASTDELIRIADKNNLDSMILGGCSMGSGTAIHAAIRYPDRVKALVLVTPPPAWEMRQRIHTIYMRIAAKAGKNKELIKKLISLYPDPPEFYEQQFPGTREKLIDLRLSFEPEYYSNIYIGGAISDLPPREQISAISLPTIIVELNGDENHPTYMARELHSLINGSELFSVSDYLSFQHRQDRLSDFFEKTIKHSTA